ncbi:aldose 1-epimerase [Streptococcus pneumoniae]|nr:aldose 1-epimerase [Streptococcus pneumoniae]
MKAYTERVFGNVEGEDVLAYRFETDGGYQLEVMTYGATILRYVAPDKAGNFANVILGFDDFDSYVGNSPKHGASVGPVAGRIAGATFELNGKTYDLEVNNASNCNHSGSTGWDSSLFEVEEVSDHGLTLYTERTDGTGGFPGNLKIWIIHLPFLQAMTMLDSFMTKIQVASCFSRQKLLALWSTQQTLWMKVSS